MAQLELTIVDVQTKAQEQAFLDLPYALYRGEPQWRAPLRFERKEQLSQKKNPTAAVLDRQLFLAMKGEDCVGRIAAFVNPAHLAEHNEKAGHFGYWDCVSDLEVGRALLETAQEWLRTKGMVKIIGPTSHTVNEECGLLVDGFDTPPVLMMPYGRPDYQTMIEGAGFEKAIDMYAFMADLNAGYPRPRVTSMMVDYANKNKDITVRQLDKKNLAVEMPKVMDIFNDAWSDNWGYVPFSDDEVAHMASEMKPLISRETFLIGDINGEPAAFIAMIPNLNEIVDGLDGKLLPLGWAKALTRFMKGSKTARIPLMGIRKEHQGSRQGLALIAKLCEDVFAAGRDKGYTHCELSWILETNQSMIRICEQASAKAYKTYRMYEKAL